MIYAHFLYKIRDFDEEEKKLIFYICCSRISELLYLIIAFGQANTSVNHHNISFIFIW